MAADDQHLAKTSKLLRRRLALRQCDVIGPGRTRHFVIRLENDGAGSLRLDDIRRHFGQLGGYVKVSVWWNGAALDRLIDRRHAQLVERSIAVLQSRGWVTETEVTFSKWGERGSVDVLGGRQPTRAAFVGEVKTEWGSLEETNRRLDIKARLAPELVEERFGWRPRIIARVLVLPNDMTARRVVQGQPLTLGSAYPARSRQVRAWIRRPTGSLRGLWFLSEGRRGGHNDAD